MQVRSEDTSYCSRSSVCSRPAYRVRQAPVRTAEFSPHVSPTTWNRGRQPITTSSTVSSVSVRAEVPAFVARFAWVGSAPVVPEV